MKATEQTYAPLIETLVREHCVDTSSERPELILSMMENERYWQGHHYYARRIRGTQVVFESVNPVTQKIDNNDRTQVYDTVLNYYRSEGLRFVGLMGTPPNAKAIADVRNDINSRRVRMADQILSGLWPHWDVECLQQELALSLWKNGTSFLYTPFVPNAKQFGTSRQEVITLEKTRVIPDSATCFGCGTSYPPEAIGHTCANCGVVMGEESFVPGLDAEIPVVSGYISFDNGTVECHLASAYSVQTPFHLKKLDDSPWLSYTREESYGKIIRAFPEFRGRLSGLRHGGTFGFGQVGDESAVARGRAMSPLSNTPPDAARMYTGELKTLWVEPDQYELINTGETENQLREVLYREYENGIRLTMCNGKLLHMHPESFKECWAAVKPTVGEYLYTQPLGAPWVQMNRAVNNSYNIMAQTAETGVPVTFFDVSMLSDGVFTKNPASVANYIGALPGGGKSLREMVHTVEPAELTQSVVNIGPTTVTAARDVTNMAPELTGGGAPTTTLGEAELKYNAALRPHNTTWNMMRSGWGRAYHNAIMLFAKHSLDAVHFNVPNSMQAKSLPMENLADIREGGWHIEVEQSIPATAGQKRAMVLQLLQMNPNAVANLPVFDTENIGPLYDFLGLGDIEIPGAAQREKIIDEINLLLTQQPIMGPDGQLSPSIPPDEFIDNHQMWVAVAKQFAVEDSGREQQRTNPHGFENLKARIRAELQIVNMMAMQQRQQQSPPPSEPNAPKPTQAQLPPESAGISMGPDRPPQPEQPSPLSL